MNWEQVLDTLGATEQWEPPADLGPLPDHLAGRAREILTRLAEQIQALEAQQVQVAQEVAALAAAGPTASHFIDTKA